MNKDQAIEQQQIESATTTALQSELAKFHESGIRFNGTDAELLAAYRSGGHEVFIEDGVALTKFDSQTIPLSSALERYAFDAEHGQFDRRTLPRSGTVGRSSIASKSDFKSIKERVAFIREFGQSQFEALPLHSPVSGEIKTQADFRALPLAEKVRLTKSDSDYVAKLAPSPGLRMPGQPFINHAALDKIKQIRPASRNLAK